MTQIYNDPANAADSSIGPQFNVHYWDRRSLIDAAEKMFFSPLADVRSMPKHYGKELKVFYYIPLLDARNLNDQGLDAAGVVTAQTEYWVSFPRLIMEVLDAASAAAKTAIEDDVGTTMTVTDGNNGSGRSGTGWTALTITAGGLQAKYLNTTKRDAVLDLDIGAVALKAGGNIYGGSKDVGTISGRMPTLTETGGRVNRVGFTRVERNGTLAEHGFFMEFTEDSLTFDTDSELYAHMSHELVAGANEVTEDLLQVDILSAAGTIVFAGSATADYEVTGVGSDSVVDYADLKRLSIALDDNRTPKNTKIIKGSRMTDTRTVNAARLMYIGSDLQTTFENMVDGLDRPAYKPVREYAAAGSILNGEIGAVGDFRIIVVPNMMNWVGAGALEGVNPGFKVTNGRYDVFPMLVVGSESFATVGLQSSGSKGGKQKFKIIVKKPGKEMATTADPYGKLGFSSITFYHGFIVLRAERIGLVKAVAPQ